MSPSTNPQSLQDRAEIVDLTYRYARGVDLRDWSLYRSCFEERFSLDAPGWPKTMAADEWVEIVRSGIENFEATQHQMSNHTIEIHRDHADCITYLRAVHHQPRVAGEARWILVGYYQLGLRRAPLGQSPLPSNWKISHFNLTIQWHEGNLGLMELGPQPPKH